MNFLMLHLLVSTPLHIFLVEPFTKEVTILRTGDGYYYGITHHSGKIVLTHTGGYLQYFQNSKNVRATSNHLVQPHQAEWVDDEIIVANTGKNCISIFDVDGNLIRDVYLNDIRWDDKDSGRVGNHFNSVHRIDDRIFVVAHNYDRPSEVWELSWPELKVQDVKSGQSSWAHNYWECEWGRIICNSKAGSIYELNSGETIWHSGEENAMTRGLAATDRYIFVGYSSHNIRKQRSWKTGGIWVIDRKTLQTVDKILLPGAGDVHEIRVVGLPDACHNDQVLKFTDLESIRKNSRIINLNYQLRNSFPFFQQDLFPFSQIVRATQMTSRWKKSLKDRFDTAR
jgi:hypothetical protein